MEDTGRVTVESRVELVTAFFLKQHHITTKEVSQRLLWPTAESWDSR